MNAPVPLTATPPARLNWSDNGAPVAAEFDDIYFSVDGGLEETKAVFLDGCDLPQAWQDRDVFVIGELGFGCGLNFLAAWDLWRTTKKPGPMKKPGKRLHFISVEAYPLTNGQLTRALDNFPALKPLADRLAAAWPGPVKGMHRIHFGSVTLTLCHAPASQALAGMDGGVHAWFLDGFSPAKNPDMWSDEVLGQIAKLSAANAKLATFTVAGQVRRGLENAGFTIAKKPGFGRKRERLQARLASPSKLARPPDIDTPVIIGGGIAGASVAAGFIRRGIRPVLIDPCPELDTAASGNPAGLMMPKLDLQDRPEARFYNSAFLYAKTLYHKQAIVLDKGILQLAASHTEQKRLAKIYANHALPEHEMQWVDSQDAGALTGGCIDAYYGGLYFPGALVLSPKLTVQALCGSATRIQARVGAITKTGNVWHIAGADGKTLAKTRALFVCNGANILDLWCANVRFTRGQICWNARVAPPGCAHVLGNYALPFKGGILLGATHSHVGGGEDNKIRTQDTADIIKHYGDTINGTLAGEGWSARASVRVTTRNTLPIAEQADKGLFVLSGLGSRGLMLAPLLGEALVCKALGEVSPLDKRTQKRFAQTIKA